MKSRGYPGLRRVRVLALAVSSLTVGGCCHVGTGGDGARRVCRQDQAGATHVAVVSVARWDKYREALQPTFKLSADDALAVAVTTTTGVEERVLDALRIEGKFALPGTSFTDTTKAHTETGKASTASRDVTRTTSSGDTSGLSFGENPAAGRSAADLPGGGIPTAPLGFDPLTRYYAATALYQEVQLLNRYVKDAAVPQGYEPYVVRLQVTLLPRQRNEPYDAFASLAFFCGGFEGKGPLAPNNLTASFGASVDEAKSVEDVKAAGKAYTDQLATAMRSATADIENVPADNLAEAKRLAVAKLFEAGRGGKEPTPKVIPLLVTDSIEAASHSRSTDQIRQLALALSAAIGGVGASTDLQKVDENLRTVLGHDLNSTFTVAREADNIVRVRFGATRQVRPDYAMIPQTHMVTLLVLVPADVVGPAKDRAMRVISKTNYVDALTGEELPGRDPAGLARAVREAIKGYAPSAGDMSDGAAEELMGCVDRNDFGGFKVLLGDERLKFAEAIWVDVASIRVGGQFAFDRFNLPAPPRPTLGRAAGDENVGAALLDDGTNLTAMISAPGTDLTAVPLRATLLLKPAGPSIPAGAVKVTDDGAVLATFPSIGTLKEENFNGAAVRLELPTLDPAPKPLEVTCKYEKTKVGKAGFVISADAKVIDSSPQGTGKLTLRFAKIEGADIHFAISGADVSNPQPGGVVAQEDPKDGAGWHVVPKSDSAAVVTFDLANLNPLANVTISARDNKTKDAADPITFPVVQLPPPGKQ